jgi:hypothetical protein
MVRRLQRRRKVKVVSLLGGDDEADAASAAGAAREEAGSGPHVDVLWKPTLNLRVVNQFATFPRGGIPSTVSQAMSFDYGSGAYFPVLYRDEFWLLAKVRWLVDG